MDLKGKEIKSKASGFTGFITGVDKDILKVTFTQFQDISVPLSKAEDLLIMDDETLEEIRKLNKKIRPAKKDKEADSRVQTYIDHYEEEEEEDPEDSEEADLEAPLEEDDEN